ncbi:hypothetical protein [Endozoicomonas lisbonensis]|uniref:Uncharacterized protein n=1 Tax=Endozoicomonas lisbonensis TaxID=3120522 RepID=A0ABV2SKV6_9GAMM
MLIFNKICNSNKLVIGCGSGLHHPGSHLGCDTLDIDSAMKPGILGDITESCLMHTEMYERYSFILCEYLPITVFSSPVFYENLDFFCQKRGLILFPPVSSRAVDLLTSYSCFHSWKLEYLNLSNRYLLSPFEYDEHLRMAHDIFLKRHPGRSYVAKKII